MHKLSYIFRQADQGAAPASPAPAAAPAAKPNGNGSNGHVVATSPAAIESAIMELQGGAGDDDDDPQDPADPSDPDADAEAILNAAAGAGDEPAGDEPAEPADPADEPDLAAELAALRAEIAELKAGKAPAAAPKKDAPTKQPATTPIAEADSHDTLDAIEDRQESLIEWCLKNWDGGTVGTGENERELTSAEVRDIYRAADLAVRRGIPARRAALDRQAEASQQAQRYRADAEAAYPWMKNAGSDERKTYDGLLAHGAALASHPAFSLILAHAIPAIVAARAKNKANRGGDAAATAATIQSPTDKPLPAARQAAPAKPPLHHGGGGAGGVRQPGTSRRQDGLKAVVNAGGSPAAVERFLAGIG